jgi:hypothetical protein
MIAGLLGQTVTARDRLRGIENRLSDGGTIGDLLPVLLGAAAFGALLYLLFVLQRRARRQEIDDPGQLFRTLLLDLNVPVRQRDLLRRIARERRLPNPAVLLIARPAFRNHTQSWLAAQEKRRTSVQEDLAHLESLLFRGPANDGPHTARPPTGRAPRE